MKPRLLACLAMLALAAALPGCKPNTAYNNSGASATPGSVNTANIPATPTSAAPATSAPAVATTSASAPASADGASSTAPK